MVEVREGVSLKGFNTWRVGGVAEFFAEVFCEKELFSAIAFAKEAGLKLTILGGGSNVLVSDGTVDGLVVKNNLTSILWQNDLVIVDSGYSLAALVRLLEQQLWCDMVFASGIPGSVGGAVKGNAGAFGGDIASHIEWTEVIRNGDIKRVPKRDCRFLYRKSGFFKNDIILRVAIRKSKCSAFDMTQKRQEFATKRRANQPGGHNAGSVFKNPIITSTTSALLNNKSAGALIEAVGLKGHTIGGAQISTKHANFIINLGSATAQDIKKLITLCKKEVKNKFGVELLEEVVRIGGN